MDVAIVAPAPVPYVIGGAENLWRGLQDHINEHTPHQAELFKLPSREHSFWELVDTYRRFSELDLSGFDVVVSTKYPAWMVRHDRHVVYLQHKLRGLYDTYHFTGLPLRVENPPPRVAGLQRFMAENAGRREALGELFELVEGLRGEPEELFAFPGPLIREVLHFLDGIGLAPEAIHRHGAISRTVAEREDHFPAGSDVFVVHHPTSLGGFDGHRGDYLFTAARFDNPKRVGLVVEAMRHVQADVPLRIAGSGPEEEHIRSLAAGDPRVSFEGRVSASRLVELYNGSRAVIYVPYLEDYGLVTVEAFEAGKPVITVTDSGGATELVEHEVNGLVTEPTPEALGAAIDRLWGDRGLRRRLGRAGRERAAAITWDGVVSELLA
jgi:glycosyltransferase involved in cell wall biosynthesis